MTENTIESQTNDVWTKVLGHIKGELSPQSFGTWFELIDCRINNPNNVELIVPDKFFGEWIREHYSEIVKSAFQKVTQTRPEVFYSLGDTQIPEPDESSEEFRVKKITSPVREVPRQAQAFYLNTNYTFNNYIVGPGSRVAYAAAMAISESPARSYNPFFIHGKSGLGKTHLLQSIANEIIRRHPGKKVLYTSSESFTNSLIQSIQTRTTNNFRMKFRSLDILLIDDIQFIGGKESTQEEFFHTFNALHDANKQIVISSDRSPKEIPGLEERLLSRFEWGLITDIQPPEFETRVAILKKKLEVEPVEVPNDVLFFIAENIKTNIRELEGALVRVCAFAQHTDGVIDIEMVKQVLQPSFKEQRKITIDAIQNHVAEFFNLKSADLRSKRRSKTVVFPRQVAMYLARKQTSHSFPEIGLYFGGKGHATVVHACNKIAGLLTSDPEMPGLLAEIEQGLYRS